MKRAITILAAFLFAVGITACQKTPESPIVAGKSVDQILEKAQKTAEPAGVENGAGNGTENSAAENGPTLAEQYGIPREYRYEAQGGNGDLSIKVDAQIITPDAGAMPIYRVKPANFTQEQVDAFWNELCAGAELYEVPDVMSRSDIEDKILDLKRLMAQAPEDVRPLLDGIEDRIAEFEEILSTAPDAAVTRADGKLTEKSQYRDIAGKEKIAEYTGVNAKGGGLEFRVINNSDLTETYTERWEDDASGSTSVAVISPMRAATMHYYNDNNSACKDGRTQYGYCSPSVPIFQDGDATADMIEKVGMTPAEAKAAVQDLLDKTGAGMMIDSIHFQDDEQDGQYDFIARPARNYAYKIFCVRAVDGVPCAYLDGGSNISIDSVAPAWLYERMSFMVNSEGIFAMEWVGPLEILEPVNQDARLMPFEDVIKVFESIMMIKYESIPEWLESVDLEINRVTLSLQRVSEQDVSEQGLLIPVWNFYGSKTDRHRGSDEDSVSVDISGSFLSINAIDGTIIDADKGY